MESSISLVTRKIKNLFTNMKKDQYGILYSDNWKTVVGITKGRTYGDIKIREGVTKIMPGAFRGVSHIESLKLPMSLREVGELAFNDKIKKIYADDLLDNIIIRSDEQYINSLVISPGGECPLPFKSVIYEIIDERVCIGVYPAKAENLESITINSSVGTIGEIMWDAFRGGKSLINVVINASIRRAIMPSAFSGCIKLETVEINGSIGESLSPNEMPIREQAFNYCHNLQSVTIKGEVKGSIGYMAFPNCSNFNLSINGRIIPKIDESSLDISEATGEINGIEYVDLGLKSGLKWAKLNMGAISVMSHPQYYQWGAQDTSTLGTWGYADHIKKIMIAKEGMLAPEFDIASIVCGSSWRMPTTNDFIELINDCEWESIELNAPQILRGITSGIKAKGPNGNSIFFPNTGCLKWDISCSPYLSSNYSDRRAVAFFTEKDNNPSLALWEGFNGGAIRPVSD